MNIYNIRKSTKVPSWHKKRGNRTLVRSCPGEQVDLVGGCSWLERHQASSSYFSQKCLSQGRVTPATRIGC